VNIEVDLLRDLGAQGVTVLKELDEIERRVVAEMKKKGNKIVPERELEDSLSTIRVKRQKAQQMADEKLQIAEQVSRMFRIYTQ
jgi:hypothetical protein